MYYSGQGVEPDFEKALYWFSEAAKQGNVNAKEACERITQYIALAA